MGKITMARRQFLGLSAVAGGFVLAAPEIARGTRAAAAVPGADGISADGTTIPPAASITDKSGAVWTVVGGVAYRDGATVGDTYNITLLLWYGGLVYQQGTGGQFYVWMNSVWLPTSDPRTPIAAPAGMFYGVNGHYDYTYTPAQTVALVQGLGCSTYRINCLNDPGQLASVSGVAEAFQAAGLTLFVVIDQGISDPNTHELTVTSESDAYNVGHSNGAAVAAALAPYGVTMYECGNELTRDSNIILDSTNAGTKAIDFSNDNWPLMRGMMRGQIDGVKSAQPGALCGTNFCVGDVGASDALWNGLQPDGSGGYPAVRWDITTWHNYRINGDIFDLGIDGAGPGFNLPIYCKARYGKPFMLTEWSANGDDPQDLRASYITAQMAEFAAARATENIQSVMYYELDSGDTTWGLVDNDGAPLDPPYSAFRNAVAANPDS